MTPCPTSPSTHLATVSDRVARIRWSPELTERGWQAAVDVVRRDVAAALVDHDAGRDAGAGRRRPGPTDRDLVRASARGHPADGPGGDLVVYARLVDDVPVHEPGGFRALLNSFLPRKRAISQMLIRDPRRTAVLLCQLTYKHDWDLPGGVVEVGESPQLAVVREVEEELGLKSRPGRCCSPTGCPRGAAGTTRSAWCSTAVRTTPTSSSDRPAGARDPVRDVLHPRRGRRAGADFSARRIRAALANLGGGPAYTESGR